MHKIVHLDLKGAPLQVPYLEKVLLAARSWGATGVLIEWEDTFPYTEGLADIGSVRGSGGDGLYSIEEVHHILQFMKANGLEPIQLVQTIGHMEFVLKHPAYHSLREVARSPAVLCPSRPAAPRLVRAMLEQVLAVQPDAKYIHIGADEVWHTAECADCKRRAENNVHRTASLFLEHIRDLAIFIKQNWPGLTILMWDDMLRTMPEDSLKAFNIGGLVQPVVWLYSVMEHFQINPLIWEVYRRIFPQVWAASAFKGANGSCQMVSPVERYVSNQEAWRMEMKKCSNAVHFAGIILTGWSRYDHYATLCELLPVSMPSLAWCLKVWSNLDEAPIDLSPESPEAAEQFPGAALARAVHALAAARERCQLLLHGDTVQTWLNPWQIENGYTNPLQVERLAISAQQSHAELSALQTELTRRLYGVTGSRSAREWLATYLLPPLAALAALRDAAAAAAAAAPAVSPRARLD